MPLNRAVVERAQAVLNEGAPLIAFDATGKDIRVEGWRARHCQDSAAMDIENDDGSFLALQRFIGGLLEFAIQG